MSEYDRAVDAIEQSFGSTYRESMVLPEVINILTGKEGE